MLETANRIREKQRERDYCLAVLKLWGQVQSQGIDINAVEQFGFDLTLLDNKQKVEANRQIRRGLPDPYKGVRLANGLYRPEYYNYVVTADGSRIRLEPALKAVHTEEQSNGKDDAQTVHQSKS